MLEIIITRYAFLIYSKQTQLEFEQRKQQHL